MLCAECRRPFWSSTPGLGAIAMPLSELTDLAYHGGDGRFHTPLDREYAWRKSACAQPWQHG
eukprot:1180165-Prorocentrum_minimum.AAC.3